MNLRALALGAIAVLSTTVPLAAATYYVAPPAAGGNDGNPGTAGQPWATLQHAAGLVAAGDTVLVRAGAFQGFHLTTSGSPGSRITFRAFPGEVVTIDQDNPSTQDGINLEGASYVTVEGFRISGRTRAGIRAVLCDHVHLRGNRTTDNGRWGIFTGCCDDLVIEGNLTSGSVDEHGIYVSNSGDRPLIRGNVIFDNHANGIHMNGDLSVDCGGATPQDGVISNALVEGNTIWNNGTGGGSGINCDGVQSSRIRNNLIYSTHASGISLYQIDGGQPSHANRIENNTVLAASDGRWGLNVQDGSQETTILNNVFWSEHSFRGAMDVCSSGCLTGLTSDFNAVEDRFTLDGGNSTLTLAQWRSQTGQDQSSVAIGSLPGLFVNLAAANFHPSFTSPLRDAGTTIPDLPSDLERVLRPRGSAYDIGALESVIGIFVDGFEGGSTVRWSSEML